MNAYGGHTFCAHVDKFWIGEKKMKKNPDIILSKVLLSIGLIIVAYWIWNGLNWLWDWYVAVSQSSDTSVWESIWIFIKDNLSIIIVVYGFISLQSSGLAEFKFGKNFLTAFFLAIIITPPIMMAVYGHKKQKAPISS